MTSQEQAYLRQLCTILEVPLSSTEPNPTLALNVLARLYLVPTIKDKGQRNRALNEIRGNLLGQFDRWGPFVMATVRIAAIMQELPHWYNYLNMSTEDLISRYKNITTGLYVRGALGLGSGVAGAVGAGAAHGSKEGSVRSGVKRFGERMAGRGPLAEEVQRRIGLRMSPKAGGAVGAVVVVGGTIAYFSAIEQQEKIRQVLLHRFKEGKMTDDQYREVFGSQIDPADIKKYWD